MCYAINVMIVDYKGDCTLYDMIYYRVNCNEENYKAIVDMGKEMPDERMTCRE